MSEKQRTPPPTNCLRGIDEDVIERIAIEYHNFNGDGDTLPWGKQKSNYRGSVRKSVRQFIGSLGRVGLRVSRGSLPSSPSDWRDIGTAPRDGSSILAWCDLWGGYHIVHWDESERAWVEGSRVFRTGPSDWKPIDLPPSRA